MALRAIEKDADRAAATGDFASASAILERAVQEDPTSLPLWLKLAAARSASGDLRGSLAATEQALTVSPLDFSALLFRATILEKLGDESAAREYGHALAQAPPDEQIPASMRGAMTRARERWQQYQGAVESALLRKIPEGLTATERRRLERFVTNRSRRTRTYHQQPTEFDYPGLPELEFHDRESFPQLALLEQATGSIRREFEALVAAEAAEIVPYIAYPDHLPLKQWKELNASDKWRAIHLLRNGERIDQNARHCPETMRVLEELPQPHIQGASPNAMFSLLAPHTRIPPHCGVANTRLVCHLPLIVPAGCGFRVGDSRREWTMGEAFVFDDTIEHEAWNDSDSLRVVLIVDLWAPTLTSGEREAITSIIETSGVSFGGA